ncbi:MAG: siroheme synthase CysG [Moraxellaceae bacterium]|nr:siroheme synthase CysG [Moraxellaceae bacterium]MDZ4387153.1 siroheme synthase CysG [Moraxellaceae bacterium]
METLPLGFRLRDRSCLIVGGGEIARRKADLVIRAGAIVTVIAPEIDTDVAKMVAEARGQLKQRPWQTDDILGHDLVIAATDDEPLNAAISAACFSQHTPVNVVDAPDLCSVIFPAIVDRSPLIVSVSSNGAAPVLARQLRARLETLIPEGYGRLAAFMREGRPLAKQQLTDTRTRRLFWEAVLASNIPQMIYDDKAEQAKVALTAMLNDFHVSAKGEVYLVGAGPGDPDLLTFKALRLMQQADVVVYDRLVSAPILDMCRRDAERIYVGKARAEHTLPQESINALLVRLALEGKRVCRLKGGDPFIFGRGGEEIEELAEAGVPFQVVPGITAASGCAAYAGIPLTHRDYAQSVRFVTGHLKDGTPDLPWQELVHPQQTLVLYMGLVSIGPIRAQLLAHGLSEQTPVAMISKGTTQDQQVLTGTLGNIIDVLAGHTLPAPTLIIIGEVVSLRNKLSWFGES